MRTVLALTGIALLAAGCSDPEPAPPAEPSAAKVTEQPAPAEPVTPSAPAPVILAEYSCVDGLLFDVVFEDQEATLHLREQRFDLHRQPSASGALYTDEHWNLFTRGERAMLTGGDLSHDCQVRASRPVAEDQQLPGNGKG